MIVLVQAILNFIGAWILGEWISMNASAARPPWKLFRKKVTSNANEYTLGR